MSSTRRASMSYGREVDSSDTESDSERTVSVEMVTTGRSIANDEIIVNSLPQGLYCHQCRRRKKGLVVICKSRSRCQLKFCASCLEDRYGLDANRAAQATNWWCPKCCDICNCSRCRNAQGLPPLKVTIPRGARRRRSTRRVKIHDRCAVSIEEAAHWEGWVCQKCHGMCDCSLCSLLRC